MTVNKHTQSFLILVSSTPYGSHQARAAIDLALTAAAFEQDVTCVFVDAGVLQLTADQDTTSAALKNVSNMLAAMKLYEVNNLYVHASSAEHHGLSPGQWPEGFLPIDDARLQLLVKQADQVMVF